MIVVNKGSGSLAAGIQEFIFQAEFFNQLQGPGFFDNKTVGAALDQEGTLFFRDNFTPGICSFFKNLNLNFRSVFPGFFFGAVIDNYLFCIKLASILIKSSSALAGCERQILKSFSSAKALS